MYPCHSCAPNEWAEGILEMNERLHLLLQREKYIRVCPKGSKMLQKATLHKAETEIMLEGWTWSSFFLRFRRFYLMLSYHDHFIQCIHALKIDFDSLINQLRAMQYLWAIQDWLWKGQLCEELVLNLLKLPTRQKKVFGILMVMSRSDIGIWSLFGGHRFPRQEMPSAQVA